MLDERRRHRMIDSFKQTHGEDTAMALAESIFSTDHATKADLKALETDLKALETRLNARVDNCATKADLEALETRLNARVDNCATKADLHALEQRVDVGFNRQLRWVVGTMVAFMGFLTTGGGIVTVALLNAVSP